MPRCARSLLLSSVTMTLFPRSSMQKALDMIGIADYTPRHSFSTN
jgi:hypothetical protein